MDDSEARFEQRRAGGAGFLADLDNAWKAAMAQEEVDRAGGAPMTTLARQVRYGLLASSMNSLAAAMPPGLVARLVADGQWTLERAVALVERTPHSRLRVLAYLSLLEVETLDGAQRRQLSARAVAILGEIRESSGWAADPSPRGQAIRALASHLDEDSLGQAVHMAMTLPGMCFRGSFGECSKTIAVLASRLQGELLEQALKEIASLNDPAERVVDRGILATRLPEARRQKLLAQALRDTLAMDNPWDRTLALGVLAPQMQGESLEQILQATMQLTGKLTSGSGGPYPSLLEQLGPALSRAQATRLLQAVVKIQGDNHRLDALAALSPYLDDDGLAQALQTVMEVPSNDWHRVRTLAKLAPRLNSAQLDHVLQVELAWPAQGGDGASSPLARLGALLSPASPPTPRLTEEVSRADLLSVLVPHLPDERLGPVLREAQVMQNPVWRMRLLSVLAPRLRGPQQGEVLRELVEAALAHGGTECADTFKAVAPILEGDLLERAVQGAVGLGGSILGPSGRSPIVEVLSALAPYLRGELLAQALRGALDIADDGDRERVLIALAPHLPDELVGQAVEAAVAMKNSYVRMVTVHALAPRLHGERLAWAAGAIMAIDDEAARAEGLATLARHLPNGPRHQALERALEALLAADLRAWRPELVGLVASQLEGGQLAPVLRRVPMLPVSVQSGSFLGMVTGRPAPNPRAEVLAILAPHLPGDLMAEAVAAVWTLPEADAAAGCLAALAPHAPDDVLAPVLGAALAMPDEIARGVWLKALAPHLRGPLITQALEAMFEVEGSVLHFDVLAALVPRDPGPRRDERLAWLLRGVLALAGQDEALFSDAVGKLAPYLRGPQLVEAAEATLALKKEIFRSSAVCWLAPHLDGAYHPALLARMVAAALAIESKSQRVQVLAALAPRLEDRRRGEVLSEALATALEIPEEAHGLSDVFLSGGDPRKSRLSLALGSLAPHLQGDLLDRALRTALAMKREGARLEILLALLPSLTGKARAKALAQVLDVALSTPERLPNYAGYEPNRTWGVGQLAPYLDGDLLKRALKATLALHERDDRVSTLAALASERPGWVQAQAALLRPAVVELLRDLAGQERGETIKQVVHLLPVWSPLAPPGAVGDVARAIVEVGWEWHW